jgi:tyrosine-protein phosphatase SIW14
LLNRATPVYAKDQALDEMLNGGYGYHARFYPNLVGQVKGFDVRKMRLQLGLASAK